MSLDDQILLRKLTALDITEKYIQGLNSGEIMQYTESRNQNWDLKKVKAYIETSDQNSELLGIFVNLNHIGSVRIHSIDVINSRCEIGILIFDKKFWNKGIGELALRRSVNYVFHELKLSKITANYFSNNSSSARLFEKVGFNIVGTMRNHFQIKDGIFQNGIFVELLKDDR